MRAVLIGVLVLLVTLVAAVLIGPSFFDWNRQKARIAQEISSLTGRPLQIAGDVSLALVPTPRLSAEDVSLANIEGASDPEMAVVEELEVQVDFWPLLRGRVQIESFSLVRPEIYLEVLPDGRRNWDFAGELGQGDGRRLVDDKNRRLANQIKLEDFQIRDGRLVYRDPKGSQVVEDFDAEISAASLLGPFSLVGSGIWQGNDTRVVINVGRLVKDGAATINLDLAFPEQKATVRFNGGVLRDREGLALRGQLRGEGANLSGFLAALDPDIGPLPAITGRAFTLTTEMRADREGIQARDLSASLDDLQVEGSVGISLKDVTDIALDLVAARLDMDSLLAGSTRRDAAATAGRARPAPKEDAGQGAPADPDGGARKAAESDPLLLSLVTSKVSLPEDVIGRFTLRADTLVYRERLVRQLQFEAGLAAGRLTIEQAQALLPGGSDLAVSGELTTPKQMPKFSGRIETDSNNFRALLDWLGFDIGSVPANRLRKMSFASDLLVDKGQLTASQFDLQLDLTRASGGLAVALRRRLGFGLGMTMDTLNLDAYLSPSIPKPKKTPPEEPATGAAQSQTGQGGADGARQVVDDASVTLSTAPRLDLGTLLDAFDANLEISIGSLTVNGVQAKGLHLDGTLRQGEATIREARVDDVLGASGAYRGELHDLRNDAILDGRFDLEVPYPNRLWKSLFGAQLDFGETGTVAAAGSIRGPVGKPQIDGSLSAYGGRVAIVGELASAPLAFDLAFDGEHPSLPKLLAAMGQKVELNPSLGAVILTGQLVGEASRLRLDNLAGQIGATEFAGELSWDRTQARPYVEAVFDVGPLVWPAVFQSPSPDREGLTDSGWPGERGWSRQPFDFSWLQDFDGKLTLSSEALAFMGLWLEDAKVLASLDNGVIEVARLAGNLYGGAFALTGRVSTANGLDSRFSLTGTGLDAKRVLTDWLDLDALSGTLDIEGSFSGKGKNEASLIGALSGEGAIRGTLAVALNETEIELAPLAPEAQRVKGIAEGLSAVQDAFSGAPIEVEGRFGLKRGSLQTQDLRLTGEGAYAVTNGRLDLSAWEIDSRTDLYRAAAPGEVYLTAKLKGSLGAPDVTISGEPLRSGASPGDGGERYSPAQSSRGSGEIQDQ